jgi:hypothetical protein
MTAGMQCMEHSSVLFSWRNLHHSRDKFMLRVGLPAIRFFLKMRRMQIRVIYVLSYPYTYANTSILHIIRMQIRVIYVLYVSVHVCKYEYYTYYTYANTRNIRIIRIRTRLQIRVLYILYVCKYGYYTYPYPVTEYASSNPNYESFE